MMNVLYALTANGRPFVENATEAGTVTLLGMGAVFSVLALLWLLIEIFHRILSGPGAKEKKVEKAVKIKATPAESSVPVAAPVADDNGALVAAITAAISAALAEEGYTGGFRVVSFKRVSGRRNRKF